jgi:hypothetical protein
MSQEKKFTLQSCILAHVDTTQDHDNPTLRGGKMKRPEIETAWSIVWKDNYPGESTSKSAHRNGFESGYIFRDAEFADIQKERNVTLKVLPFKLWVFGTDKGK